MRLLVLIALVAVTTVWASTLPPPFTDHCVLEDNPPQNLYVQAHARDVDWYTINLDMPPKDRWTRIASKYKVETRI